MSNAQVGNVYQQIIADVIDTSRVDFEEGGVDDNVLEELKQVCHTSPFPLQTIPFGIAPLHHQCLSYSLFPCIGYPGAFVLWSQKVTVIAWSWACSRRSPSWSWPVFSVRALPALGCCLAWPSTQDFGRWATLSIWLSAFIPGRSLSKFAPIR
jgi:hypothetical protein